MRRAIVIVAVLLIVGTVGACGGLLGSRPATTPAEPTAAPVQPATQGPAAKAVQPDPSVFPATAMRAAANWCQGWWDKVIAAQTNDFARDSTQAAFQAELNKLKGTRISWKLPFGQIEKCDAGARMPVGQEFCDEIHRANENGLAASYGASSISVGNQEGLPPAAGQTAKTWRSIVFPVTEDVKKLSRGDHFILDAKIVSATAESKPAFLGRTFEVYFLVDDVKIVPVFKNP